jgi:hypothetical protein
LPRVVEFFLRDLIPPSITQEVIFLEAEGESALTPTVSSIKYPAPQGTDPKLIGSPGPKHSPAPGNPTNFGLNKKNHSKRWISIISLWLLLALWILLSPPFTGPINPVKNTQAVLEQLRLNLLDYKAQFKEFPNNLGELRSFVFSKGKLLSLFDAYGERIDYLRLDDSSFLIRSFGEDGIQNTAGSPKDIGLINWGTLPHGGAFYQSRPELIPHFYRAPSLLGLDSPDGSWQGRLFTQKKDQTRHLAVRHRLKQDLIMIAPHDRIEEFYWVSPNALVFTGTESYKMKDGIYLWNLIDDSIVDLLRSVTQNGGKEVSKLPILADQAERGYWLTLAGFNAKTKQLYAYITAKNGYMLNPLSFFSAENFFEYTLHEDPRQIKSRQISHGEFYDIIAPKKFDHTPLTEKLSLGLPFVSKKPKALPIQESWLKLPKSGRLEPSLLAWQQFSIQNAKTPLFAYSLWYLISLYNESFLLVKPINARESEILRTYGAEISQALMNDVMAPGYLRAMGAFCYQTLIKGQSLPYKIFYKMSLK